MLRRGRYKQQICIISTGLFAAQGCSYRGTRKAMGLRLQPSNWLNTARNFPGLTGLFSNGAPSLFKERRH